MAMFGFDDQYAMFGVTPLDNQFILEYMPTAKGDDVKVMKDNWTVVTKSGSLSAHFEHMIAITPDGPVILTQP